MLCGREMDVHVECTKRAVHLKNLTCELNGTNYISNLEYYGNDDITRVSIHVDTGVSSQKLAQTLSVAYPNLKYLSITQQSFYDVDRNESSDIGSNITILVKSLGLTKLFLVHKKALYVDSEKLFKYIPGKCTYHISIGDLDCRSEQDTHIDPAHDKYMVMHQVKMCNDDC